MPRTGPGSLEGGLWIREEIAPSSRKKHRRIRIAETNIGPYHVQLGESLKRREKRYVAFRIELMIALLAISTAGAGAAYLVASHGLRPLRRLADEAKQLSALSQGELPRTGTEDESDALAQVLNDLLRRMRSEVDHVRGLTANVAHALHTPLTAIRGHLELLLSRHAGLEPTVLPEVLEELEGLIRLVIRLLLLEELEVHGHSSLNIERLDLAELTRKLVDHLRVLADEGGVELTCEAGPTIIQGDPIQLREALGNLIDNALRETPRGEGVEVRVQSDESGVRVIVRDTGPGLSPEELEHVFDRFYAGERRKGTGGGLGLPIARAHGGDLCASSPGGAEFMLQLPPAASV